MNFNVIVDDRNKTALILMQSLWGAISPNFRMVAFSLFDQGVKLLFVLDADDPLDREEIDDICAEFDALQDSGSAKFEVEIIVDSKSLAWPDDSWVVVFRRREFVHGVHV